ncbi:S-adenosyl-L-methionine-dependent methyltransferase domain protein, partial [Bordetella pertussis H897]
MAVKSTWLVMSCRPGATNGSAWAWWLQRGAALLLDYGFPRSEYYHPQRAGGTLMCHLRHHAHADPFVAPGLQDITSHVDFTAMADAALA